MKKKIIIVIIVVLIVLLAICFIHGLKKVTSVELKDYSVLEDGNKIKLTTIVTDSVGYTRGIKIKNEENKMYISFYSTFGLLNSKLGARNEFEIDVGSKCEKIYFDRGNDDYKIVLKKDEYTNEWSMIEDYNKEPEGFDDIPKELEVEEAVNRGYFVIDGKNGNSTIYNKDILDRFIENTSINSKDRKPDKIRIVTYNYDGYPVIYELEYKTFDEKYVNEENKEVNKTGYILTKDASRNEIEPKSLEINDDIPGNIYGIVVEENREFDVAIIKLALYGQINQETEPYKEIEIARYLLTEK